MKQYVIDELRLNDYQKIKSYLDDQFGPSQFGSIYWIPLADDLLSDEQVSHKECQPFYFAVDLSETRMACELLIRTKQRVKCTCIAYATERQRNWLIDFIDTMINQLQVTV